MRTVSQRVEIRLTARQFIDYLEQAAYHVVHLIGGIVDQTVNVVRALTIWSVLVLGVGFLGMVLIGNYVDGRISLPLMLGGLGATLIGAMAIGLLVAAAVRRARYTIQRMRIPEWLSEEG